MNFVKLGDTALNFDQVVSIEKHETNVGFFCQGKKYMIRYKVIIGREMLLDWVTFKSEKERDDAWDNLYIFRQ